jgi:hypothetical protein
MCRLLTHHNLSKPICQRSRQHLKMYLWSIQQLICLTSYEIWIHWHSTRRSAKIIQTGSRSFKSGNPATRYFRSKKEFNLHRILRAIDNNTIVKINRRTFVKFWNWQVQRSCLKVQWVSRNYKKYRILIEECNFEFEFKTRNKKILYKSKEGDRLLLENLAKSGLVKRYGNEQRKRTRNKRTKSNQRLKL